MVFARTWSGWFAGRTSGRHRGRRPRLLHIESLEDRAVPAVTPALFLFDATAGRLALHAPAGTHTVRETLTADGFVDATLDGQPHSSDPASVWFDPALAGARRGGLSDIRFDGDSQDTLILGSETLTGGLTVEASGAKVTTEDVSVSGLLTIDAASITIAGMLRGAAITLHSPGWVTVEAAGALTAGSRIDVSAAVFVNSGQVHADGATGGQVSIHAVKVLNAGAITASGRTGQGGTVAIDFSDTYIDTATAVTAADGGWAGAGGNMTLSGGTTGRLYSSGRQQTTGGRVGGTIALLGRDVVLAGAVADASGANGGGRIFVGALQRGVAPGLNAQTVTVTAATQLRADARNKGNGGRVLIWADQTTRFDGSASARGGPAWGSGGPVEVSAGGTLTYGGAADTGAAVGKAGTLLLDPKNLVISAAPAGVLPQFDFIDPHPTTGGNFGATVQVLRSGNIIVLNPKDNFGGNGAGAAYLFDGLTGTLISALVGSAANDDVGAYGVTVLANGNYVVASPDWNGDRGAVTWGSDTVGVSGTVSAANSLVGSNTDDSVGVAVTVLANGNYVVRSPDWNGDRGAVTWGSDTVGVSGTVSAANSLVGSNPNDNVGGLDGGVDALSNGSYVVRSPDWNGERGALTWGNGTTGITGPVSAANSLVGSNRLDVVGLRVTALTNGNFVVGSPGWSGGRGAVTWGSGTAGVSGTISATNSLIGADPGDAGGNVTALANGNYVVGSPGWSGGRGAVTWGSGTTGVSGTISAANSLVGANPGDSVGYTTNGGNGVLALANGNYVVESPFWNGGLNNGYGAVTWASGSIEVTGVVSAANSLVGSNPGDHVGFVVAFLANGNFVVDCPTWNGFRGAATWGSGTAGVTGTISAANSLVGSNPGDVVGSGVTALANGNYVVVSSGWNGNRGAVTWGSDTAGVTGTISAANSLIGSNPGDDVGGYINGATALTNGDYVVLSPDWGGNGGINSGRGAATWGSGTAGVTGTISAANSLVGSNPGDDVGDGGLTRLANGDYVVLSPDWGGNGGINSGRGAATWGSGTAGVTGTISAANSLVGSNPGDVVGSGVTALANGNYVVVSSGWNGGFSNGAGAVTWGSGTAGVTGPVSAANSLIGSHPGDMVGRLGVTLLANGNYVVASPDWNGDRGAVTWGSAAVGVSGPVSATNSLIGSNPNDNVGGNAVTFLANGNYVVASPSWNSERGAVTWGSGASGHTLDGSGTVTPQNSVLGQTANTSFFPPVILDDPLHQAFVVAFPHDGTGRVTSGFVDPNLLTYSRGQSQTITITPDLLTRTLDTGTAVVLQASNDITINSPIAVSAGGHGGALTLEAGRSILLNASITTDNGSLTLIANDRLADGVVDSQRDPGDAVITMAAGTALDTGTAPLTITLRNGAGKTNRGSGAVTLQTVTAGTVRVVNHGPSAGSNILVGPVTSSGPQTYTDPHGTTTINGNLMAGGGNAITFFDAVSLSADGAINAAVVDFAGRHTQTLQGATPISVANLVHNGRGTLRLVGTDLTVTGTLLNSAGIFDANGQNVTVLGLTTIDNGTAYLGSSGTQTFGGGLSLPAGGSLNGSDVVLGGDVAAGADGQGNPATISGNLSLGGADRTFFVTAGQGTAQLVVSAVITDSQGAGLIKDGPGTLRLLAGNTYTGLTTVVNGLLVIDGNQGGSDVSLQGGTLAGSGTVGNVTSSGSLLSPGDPEGPGVLTSQGNISFDSGSTFSVRLNGTNAGTDYDQLSVAEALDLASDGGAGSTLMVSVGFASQVGDTFTIATTGAGVNNTFAGLPEGATFLVDGMLFQITYQGNGGTDIVLTHIAAPGSPERPLVLQSDHDSEGPSVRPADFDFVGEQLRVRAAAALAIDEAFWIDAGDQGMGARPRRGGDDPSIQPGWGDFDTDLDARIFGL